MLSKIKGALWVIAPGMFQRLVAPHRGQTFAIGIRQGPSPFQLQDVPHNPVLTCDDVTDVPAAFVADPFMVPGDDGWYMFMEVFDRTCRKGRIGLAVSTDGCTWTYRHLVLKEAFHLAYPNIVRDGGGHFMVPDAPGQGVRLYRAAAFPEDWRFETVLIDDPSLVDATVLHDERGWWILAGRSNGRKQPMSLCLFQAPSLRGPWREHPRSPIVESDDAMARPGGNVFEFAGERYRLAQDCALVYGQRLRALRIEALTEDGYQESDTRTEAVLGPGRAQWNAGGMHHMDAHELPSGDWIACVDGWR